MERRKASRRAPRDDESLSRVRLRTGRDLTVLNVSPSGVLAEGSVRLLPGTHVDVHVVTREGRVPVRSRVLRCWVSRVCAESVTYCGALAFDRLVDTAPGYDVPRKGEVRGNEEVT